MSISEKIRTLRKQAKISQEELAEKIGVSRQAITKWETDGGLPDIENLMALSNLFSVSMDDLLSDEKLIYTSSEFIYKSLTEVDIKCPTDFDIKTPGVQEIRITATDEEKLHVSLSSNVLQTLSQDYMVQLDEHRNRLDVKIRRIGQSSEAEGKESLFIKIALPAKFCNEVELSAVAQNLKLSGLAFPIEVDGKIQNLELADVTGKVVLNCDSDMVISAHGLPNALEVNQINATSVVQIPRDEKFFTRIKGKSNTIRFAESGKPVESFADPDAEKRIELAGMNAELLIETTK